MKVTRQLALAIFAAVLLLGGIAYFLFAHQASSPEHAPRKIVFQLNWFPEGESAYVYLAQSRGIFAKHGFDATIQGGRGSELSARLLAAGKVDVALVGGDALVGAVSRGADIRSIGIVYRGSPVVIYSLKAKGILKLQDLYGKRLGTLPGSNTFLQYEGVAHLIGLDRSRITEIALDASIAENLLLQDKIDALMQYSEKAALDTRVRGYDINEIPLKDYGAKIVGMSVAVRTGTFSASEVAELQAAIREAFWQSLAHPEEAFDALRAANPQAAFAQSDNTIATNQSVKFMKEEMREFFTMACGGEIRSGCKNFLGYNREGWEDTIATMKKFGMLSSPLAADDVTVR